MTHRILKENEKTGMSYSDYINNKNSPQCSCGLTFKNKLYAWIHTIRQK